MKKATILAILLFLFPLSSRANCKDDNPPHCDNHFKSTLKWIGHHKLFLTFTAARTTGMILDVGSTESAFRRCASCYESMPHLFGGHRPSALQLYASDGIIEAGFDTLNWFLIKQGQTDNEGDKKWWYLLAGVNTAEGVGFHLYGWEHNNGLPPDHVMPGTVDDNRRLASGLKLR